MVKVLPKPLFLLHFEKLITEISKETSSDPELKNKGTACVRNFFYYLFFNSKGKIRVLEIGVGTGVNFTHYPENVKLRL